MSYAERCLWHIFLFLIAHYSRAQGCCIFFKVMKCWIFTADAIKLKASSPNCSLAHMQNGYAPSIKSIQQYSMFPCRVSSHRISLMKLSFPSRKKYKNTYIYLKKKSYIKNIHQNQDRARQWKRYPTCFIASYTTQATGSGCARLSLSEQ